MPTSQDSGTELLEFHLGDGLKPRSLEEFELVVWFGRCFHELASPVFCLALSVFLRSGLVAAGACLLAAGCGSADSVASPKTWEVALTGADFRWQITDPGSDGHLGTPDDITTTPPLRLIAGTRTRITLLSRDYLYMLELPEAGVRQIAVPDLRYTLDVDTGPARQTEFLGDQFCGFAHAELSGTILVQDWSEYRAWQRETAEARQKNDSVR